MGWTPGAIIVAGLLVAGSVLYGTRWEAMAIRGADGNPGVIRMDRWTGRVAPCSVDVQKTLAAKSVYFDCPAP